jgi:hypothetical protein
MVKFFHDKDFEDAAKIAVLLHGWVTGPVVAQSVNDTRGLAPEGQFEVWLANNASAVSSER